ncbi:hypothetical protein GCM10023350_01190 [Nocardioides endophyticus]|uniref:Uncharacterized protein n=1 Tax=Nocardioides endophyticus TaxID=1353775 RepID=A0ABP8Y806_9ACTN
MSVPVSARPRFRRMAVGDPQVMAFYPRPRTREEVADRVGLALERETVDGSGMAVRVYAAAIRP